MTIYNLARVRELANEKARKDTEIEDIELSDEEFRLYFLLHNIAENLEEWKFYTSDDIYDEIIDKDDNLRKMYGDPYDMGMDDCLEEAKSERLIKGFLELGNDLWMIYE